MGFYAFLKTSVFVCPHEGRKTAFPKNFPIWEAFLKSLHFGDRIRRIRVDEAPVTVLWCLRKCLKFESLMSLPRVSVRGVMAATESIQLLVWKYGQHKIFNLPWRFKLRQVNPRSCKNIITYYVIEWQIIIYEYCSVCLKEWLCN